MKALGCAPRQCVGVRPPTVQKVRRAQRRPAAAVRLAVQSVQLAAEAGLGAGAAAAGGARAGRGRVAIAQVVIAQQRRMQEHLRHGMAHFRFIQWSEGGNERR